MSGPFITLEKDFTNCLLRTCLVGYSRWGSKSLFLLSARSALCKPPYSHNLLQSKVQSERKFSSRVLTQNCLSGTGLQLWAVLFHPMLKKEEGAPRASCGIRATFPLLKTQGKGSASNRSHHFVISYSVTNILLGSVHALSHLVAVATLWKRPRVVSFSYTSIMI